MNLQNITNELKIRQEELESRIERTHKHTYQKDEPVSPNFNEQVKETENDALVMALEAEGVEELAQVNKALERIESGDYLSCAACGEDIGEERLKAIPYTDNCIKCAN
jgi:DnaK suppressor protein